MWLHIDIYTTIFGQLIKRLKGYFTSQQTNYASHIFQMISRFSTVHMAMHRISKLSTKLFWLATSDFDIGNASFRSAYYYFQ